MAGRLERLEGEGAAVAEDEHERLVGRAHLEAVRLRGDAPRGGACQGSARAGGKAMPREGGRAV